MSDFDLGRVADWVRCTSGLHEPSLYDPKLCHRCGAPVYVQTGEQNRPGLRQRPPQRPVPPRAGGAAFPPIPGVPAAGAPVESVAPNRPRRRPCAAAGSGAGSGLEEGPAPAASHFGGDVAGATVLLVGGAALVLSVAAALWWPGDMPAPWRIFTLVAAFGTAWGVRQGAKTL